MTHALADILLGTAGVEAHGVLHEFVELEFIGAAGEAHDVVDPLLRRLRTDVNEDEGAYVLGVLEGVLDGVEAAHAVPHEDEAFESKLLANGFHVGHERLTRVVAIGRPLAVAVAALVERDQAVACRLARWPNSSNMWPETPKPWRARMTGPSSGPHSW